MKRKTYFVQLILPILFLSAAPLLADSQIYTAELCAPENGPRPVVTQASGTATFAINQDNTISYEVDVANLENPYMAHLHLSDGKGYGPMILWLMPEKHTKKARPLKGRIDGVLCKGVITPESLIGPLTGKTMADLTAAMEAGAVYVNVHTGQYREGELQGTVR